MTSSEVNPALFKEASPDRYILISEESVALGAAWRVLQGFEISKEGQINFYDDTRKDSTFQYLRDGGEERPYSGIFSVEVRESYDAQNQLELQVCNRNGIGNEDYRATLRAVIDIVGVEQD